MERQFNFVSELVVLVDYEVISKYTYVLSHQTMSKNSDLIIMTTAFFKRVVFQFK